MRKWRRYLVIVSVVACVMACEEKDSTPESPILLTQSIITADRANEIQRITTTFRYNENNQLIQRERNDTTFSKSTNTYLASQRRITYTYTEDGLLSKSSQEIISLTDFRTVESSFSYRNGLLVGEKVGSVITIYSYDTSGELTEVKSTYPSGREVVSGYQNNVPLAYQVEGNGYSYSDGQIKSYYNADLQLIKREQLSDGRVTFVEDRSYHTGKSYYDAIPLFKGFPIVKSEAYKGGILNTKTIYDLQGGGRVLTDNEKFTATFNAEGFLIKREGTDNYRLNTDSPQLNKVTYEYEYSR